LNSIDNLDSELKNNISVINKNVTTGVFTYNFITQLNRKKYKSINQWGKFILDKLFEPIWNSIEKIANQIPKIIW
jgi:hypothetical protein